MGIVKKNDDISVYIEDREYIANKYVLRCISVTMLIFSLVFLLNVIGVFVIEHSLMFWAYIPSLLIYVLIMLVSQMVSLSNKNMKYIILLGVVAIFTVAGIFITYHVVLLPILTFLYATLYSSKWTMVYVYVLTMISTIIIVYGGYAYGLCDANMALLTNTNLKEYMQNGEFILTQVNQNPYVTLMLFFVVPRLAVYIAFVFVCSSIYTIVYGSVERAKLSAELEKAKEEAENANKAKSQFLTRMSHEIRTPINAVLGMNEMILRESMELDTRKYACDIKSSANTLLCLINDILDSSKIESGKMELVPDNYKISNLLNDLYNMIIVKADDKGLVLKFCVDPSIPSEYYGDDIRIRQVLVNLLTNAVKYTKEGSVTLTVTGKTEGEYTTIRYMVKDTGMGIKDEDYEKLFSQFERIEESKNRNIEGTGLGMNICVQLLKLMGSELKVNSIYGKGSEFSFEVQQKVINSDPLGDFKEKALSEEYEVNDSKGYVAPNISVLVVDDNEVNRKVFKNLLKRTKINVSEADGGKACLTLLEKQSFDLVFLDYMMPEMDGVETLHAIKAKNLCADTPIIMLTANAVVGAREEYLKEGFDDYLTKPIAPDKLDQLILHYVSKDAIMDMDNFSETKESSLESSLPELEEFDFQYAMALLKQEELLLRTLEDFYVSLDPLSAKLCTYYESIEQEEIRSGYRIEVHALKSTAATVGALLLSKLARMLEVAALENDLKKLTLLHPVLMDEIEKHKNRIATVFPERQQKVVINSMDEVLPYFEMLQSSLSVNDFHSADLVCDEIKKYKYPAMIEALVQRILEQVLELEAEGAMDAIEKMKEKVGETV